MTAITIGPLAFSLSSLFLLAGLGVVFALTGAIERRGDRAIGRPIWMALFAGLVCARVVFVIANQEAYAGNWLSVLYLWQDGYSAPAGVAGAVLFALLLGWRRSLTPWLLAPLLAGAAVWLGLGFAADRLASMHHLPEIVLADLHDRPVALSQFDGKPLIVNLWASWCPPCRREMPVFMEAQDTYAGVHFVFANQREAAAVIKQFLDQQELELDHVLQDPAGKMATHFGARAMPTTLMFDARGRLVDSHMGEISGPRLYHYVQKLKKPVTNERSAPSRRPLDGQGLHEPTEAETTP